MSSKHREVVCVPQEEESGLGFREIWINKIETNNSATVAAKAQKKLHIAKEGAKELSSVVTQLQRLNSLEADHGIGLVRRWPVTQTCFKQTPCPGWRQLEQPHALRGLQRMGAC